MLSCCRIALGEFGHGRFFDLAEEHVLDIFGHGLVATEREQEGNALFSALSVGFNLRLDVVVADSFSDAFKRGFNFDGEVEADNHVHQHYAVEHAEHEQET